MRGDMQSPVTALLDLLDGKGISVEDARVWREALAQLESKGPMREKLDSFAKTLGLQLGKAGAPKKITPYVEWARRADALVALRNRQKKSGGREKALREVALQFGIEVDELERWSNDKELRAFIAETLPAMEARYRQSQNRLVQERASTPTDDERNNPDT